MTAVVSKHAPVRRGSTSASPRRAGHSASPGVLFLRLVADADEELDASTIAREFPTVPVIRDVACQAGDVIIDDFAWRGAFDLQSFDDAVLPRASFVLSVRGNDAAGVGCEALTRYQSRIARRNDASTAPLFDAVLEAHASLFDLPRTLAEADHQHALDTWQWMLRLAPGVGSAAQIAALFHDVDRLEGDAHERIEHRARRGADDPRAKRGGERALAILRGLGVDEEDALRVSDLVGGRAQADRDAALLDDADGLSFLSLCASTYADHFGLAQTRRKVAYTLGRLGPAAREKVPLLRLRPDVARLIPQ